MESLFHLFDRAVVIGLNRIAEFYEQIPTESLRRVQLFPAINARNCKPPPAWGNEIPGLWGCGESHRQVIARALSDGIGSILIMEDDCRFTREAGEVLDQFIPQIPHDWQALMFGGQIEVEAGKTTLISPRVSRCDAHVERLHCYALNREGMQIYHDTLCEQTAEPNDYRWGRLQAEGRLRVYRIEPFIAYQGASRSDISGRIEANRIWDERVDVRLRDPADIPVVAMVCPFDVMERLRDEGLIANGGESPPFMPAATVEASEMRVAEAMARAWEQFPQMARAACDRLHSDTAYHRDGAFALWHPTQAMPHPAATVVRATECDEARRIIQRVLRQHRARAGTTGQRMALVPRAQQ